MNFPPDFKTMLYVGDGIAASGTEAEVCGDISRRQQMGIQKYGQTVANNPLELKAWLQHAYEEALDQAIYLKRAIAELDFQKEHQKGSPMPITQDTVSSKTVYTGSIVINIAHLQDALLRWERRYRLGQCMPHDESVMLSAEESAGLNATAMWDDLCELVRT